MNIGNDRKLLFSLLLYICSLCLPAQSYQFDLFKTEGGVFYTDTVVIDGYKTLPKTNIINYVKQKYQGKNLPITYKDSTAMYVISYFNMSRGATLWVTAKYEKIKDSTKTILFQFEIQEPEEYNTPSPKKATLEEIFAKYQKNNKQSTKGAYEALFSEIEVTILRAKKELANLSIQSNQNK